MSDQTRIIEATMGLLADRPYEEVTVTAIADAAGISLAALASHFPSRGHILDAFVRRIDEAALSGDFSDMADEPPRERLFDVLMARLDALRPYRSALASLMHAVRRDPQLALGLNALAVRSQGWMLAAAGIQPVGWRGRIATQGLAVSFTKVLRVFVKEEDAGLPRTMAALDRELRQSEANYQRAARFFGDAVRDVARPPRVRATDDGAGDAFAAAATVAAPPPPPQPAAPLTPAAAAHDPDLSPTVSSEGGSPDMLGEVSPEADHDSTGDDIKH